ncbi:MAG: hypothetical protein RIR26_1750 [Pseudomonadota bacterium]
MNKRLKNHNSKYFATGMLQRFWAKFVIVSLLLSLSGLSLSSSAAPLVDDPEKTRFEEDTKQSIRIKLQADVGRFCPDGCSLIGIEVVAKEVFDTSAASLGFDSGQSAPRKFAVKTAQAEILIDNRLGNANIEKIQDVLRKSSSSSGLTVDLEFTRTTLPDTPQMIRAESDAKRLALDTVKDSYQKVINEFCPDECRLNTVELSTVRQSVDDAQSQPPRRVFVIEDSKWALVIQGTSVNMSIDGKMSDSRRAQIEDLMRDSMEAFGKTALNVKLIPFPRSARQLDKDADDLRADPWGLEKLGRALKIFKEFANTKEIIRERESQSLELEKQKEVNIEKNSKSDLRENIREKSDKSTEINHKQSENTKALTTEKEERNDFWTEKKVLLVAGAGALLLLVAAFGLRYVLTGKKLQHLITEGRSAGNESKRTPQNGDMSDLEASIAENDELRAGHQAEHSRSASRAAALRPAAASSGGISEEMSTRLNIQALRDELTQAFISQPKIARDIFARILREDGVEFAAKCVAVLGEFIFFDLVGDEDLKKEVALLAEYIHVNTPFVADSEQLIVLRSLKLKMAAGKMRLMTQNTRDTFDFLRSLSARQIYDLIADESSRSQAVVLTQLATEKRRNLFELFDGSLKTDLLKELCVKEALPREYLQNVAEALKRKLRNSGLSDGEMLGGADVLVELMERSDKQSQFDMMQDLDITNPELARQVRARLVSVETLGYLSDGLLLEIFLSMDPQVMVVFLAGVRPNVRNMILSKAPDEIAEDWGASAASTRGFDSDSFRLAEMQVVGKVRGFAASGILNLIEINEIMFPRNTANNLATETTRAQSKFRISSPIVA